MGYMSMEKHLNEIEKLKLQKETKKLLEKQVELFYAYKNEYTSNYKVNDEVILSNNNLIHGTRANIETLKIISQNGLISSEFYSELNPNKKKPYVIELWDIKETIKLSNWIEKYTGVTIDFKNREGNVYKSVISSFNDIKNNIQKEKGFRDYIIYQNQEQRFVPNDVIENEATVAFIVEYNNNDKLIQNDIFNKNLSTKIVKDILPKWFYEKYMLNRSFDNYETGREKAILFGVPVSMIKGIVVSRKFEKETKSVEILKELFPNCYICNLDGKVIVANS